MPNFSLRAGIEANSARLCVNERCNRLRYRLEATCKVCQRSYLAYGSPNGKPIRQDAWKPYRTEVQRLLRIPGNDQNPALLEAVEFVEDWFAQARRSVEPNELDIVRRFKGDQEALRLHRAGVSPRLIVETVAAVSMYIGKAPMMSLLEEQHAIARAIFGLAHRNAKVSFVSGKKRVYRDRASRASLVATGRHFMEGLAVFVALAKQGVQTMVETDAKRIAAVRLPFNPH